MLTGDIEKIAENEILKEYENSNILNANILKVAHHGSKSSSINEFLEKVKPQIALIGVGEKNTFGHPNAGVLNRLENLNTKIYRTDEKGEITIKVDDKGKMKIKTKLWTLGTVLSFQNRNVGDTLYLFNIIISEHIGLSYHKLFMTGNWLLTINSKDDILNEEENKLLIDETEK